MRGVLFLGAFDGALLAGALALNAVYIALGMAAYLYAFRRARERGALLQVGE
jgi:ABC-2 type transport system permease protein